MSNYYLSGLADRTDAVLFGLGVLWAGLHLLVAVVRPRRRRRAT